MAGQKAGLPAEACFTVLQNLSEGGRLAQLVRASHSHCEDQRFESSIAHHCCISGQEDSKRADADRMGGKAERQVIGARRQSASGRPEFDDRRMRGAESSIAHHPTPESLTEK